MPRPTCILWILLLAFGAHTAGAQNAAIPPTPGESEAADLVVVRIAGQPVTEKQVIQMIDDLARQANWPLEKLRQRNDLLFQSALDNLITYALLKAEAHRQNLTVNPAPVEQQVAQISKQFSTREEFIKALSSQGLTEAKLRQNLEERIRLQTLVDEILKKVAPASDADIEKFYRDNPAKFQLPERVHAAHILLKTEPQSTPEQKAAIRRKLEAIHTDIATQALTFADAAAKYSQDTASAAKGGDLGVFARGRMVKPFEDAAFSTRPGTLSPIVETQFGYHIIQCLELKPAAPATLEESRAAIRQYLDQAARQAAHKSFVDELKSKAPMESFMTKEEFLKRHPVE